MRAKRRLLPEAALEEEEVMAVNVSARNRPSDVDGMAPTRGRLYLIRGWKTLARVTAV